MKDDTKEIKWIKLDVGLFDDEKIKLIQAVPDGNALIVIWLQLLCLAGRVNSDGFLLLTPEVPYTEDMLSATFHCPLNTIRMAMTLFERYGMIEIISDIFHVSNWRKHQSAEGLDRIREQNRIRKQNERERNRQKLLPSGEAPDGNQPPPPPPAPEPKPAKEERHKYGQYGWVKLTDKEHEKLLKDLGQTELERCITYIDESAQGNGNKNKWKDWNLVIRRCHRERWGIHYGSQPPPPPPAPEPQYSNYEDWDNQ